MSYMKQFLRAILIVTLALALSAGLFSCKKEQTPAQTTDVTALSLEAVEAAIPDGALNAEIAAKLLSALSDAEFERAEIISSLRALKERGDKVSEALVALYENNFAKENANSIRVALGAIAEAVSPEAAGELYYSVASSFSDALPHSKQDCRKVATLVFGLNVDLDESFLSGIFDSGLSSIGAKEINTLFRAVSSSLDQTKTLSEGAKVFLFNYLTREIDAYAAPEGFTEEQIENLVSVKKYLKELAKIMLDNFEIALTYLSSYFANATSRLILGGAYAKTDEILYYGYDYENWATTQLTKEEFEARAGDHDEYFALEGTASGYYEGDRFVKIEERDVALGEKAYALQVLYQAYRALTDEQKAAFRTFTNDAFTTLAEDETTVMLLFGLTERHEAIEGARTATFGETVAALASLSSFDSTDGVSDHERATATAAIETFEAFLRGYFPHLF